MKAFLYLIIFALIFIILKAFYLDDWLEKRTLDAKASVEENRSSISTVVIQPENNTTVQESHQKPKSKHEGMPVNELGESIAEKLEGKF